METDAFTEDETKADDAEIFLDGNGGTNGDADDREDEIDTATLAERYWQVDKRDNHQPTKYITTKKTPPVVAVVPVTIGRL